jgi:hypothetical protein
LLTIVNCHEHPEEMDHGFYYPSWCSPLSTAISIWRDGSWFYYPPWWPRHVSLRLCGIMVNRPVSADVPASLNGIRSCQGRKRAFRYQDIYFPNTMQFISSIECIY